MAIFNNSIIPAAAAAADDVVTKSLRFNSGDSPVLTRTPSSSGSQRIFTMSMWVKRSELSSAGYKTIWSSEVSGYNYMILVYYLDGLRFQSHGLGATPTLQSNAVFRDVSAFYHIVLSVDTTQATDTNRVKIYVNGSAITFSSSLYPTLNYDLQVNTSSYVNRIGYSAATGQYFDGYQAGVHFIDGTALTPTSFAEEDTTTGQWKPKAFSGTYGTNGFHLDFEDSADIGNDASGNANDFTATNLAASDVVNDTPTNNFCTWNPISGPPRTQMAFSEGNLRTYGGYDGHDFPRIMGTMAASSGKWFYEVRSGGADYGTGVQEAGFKGINTTWPSYGDHGLGGGGSSGDWEAHAEISYSDYHLGIKSCASATALTTDAGQWDTAGDVIGLALDLDASPRTMKIYKNGTGYNSANLPTGGADAFHPAIDHTSNASGGVSTEMITNFGQNPTFNGNESGTTYTTDANGDDTGGEFYHQPPAGYKAWTTKNLTATIAKPKEHFDVLTYASSGAKTFDNGTTSMQPDLVWVKARGNAYDHELTDSVRGVTKALSSNATNVESTDSTGLTVFGSDGFTVGAGTNYSTSSMVAWAWKKSTTAGFGISTWTGTGSEEGNEIDVAHGCGGTPELVIAKDRDGNYGSGFDWIVWHKLSADKFLILNDTSAEASWDSSYPLIQAGVTNNTFGLDSTTSGLSLNDGSNSMNGETTYVAYSMRSIEGYSKVGSYTGNGSADGPFVYCGFRPAYIMVKNTSSSNWLTHDSKRDAYNPTLGDLFPNTSGAEETGNGIYVDFLSNGFKTRETSTVTNTSGQTYIFYAVAESPFKYANAR